MEIDDTSTYRDLLSYQSQKALVSSVTLFARESAGRCTFAGDVRHMK